MATDPTLQTYADVLVKAYGQRAKTFIYAMCEWKTIELNRDVL